MKVTTMTTTVNVVSGGIIKFDGGTMFGQVPKAYWESKIPTDRKNRITSRRKRGMAPGLSPTDWITRLAIWSGGTAAPLSAR